jgi:trimeric autotransporter adhesin
MILSFRFSKASPLFVLALGVITSSCGGGTSSTSSSSSTTAQGAQLTQISVFPASAPSIFLPGTVKMTAQGTYGNPASPNAISKDVTNSAKWSSSNEELATVVAGVVVGTNNGAVTITATFEGLTASSLVVVGLEPDISITPFDPGAFSLSQPSRQFVATAKYGDGTVLDLTDWVKWSASPPGIAKFDDPYGLQPGLATFISTGTATITATFSGADEEFEGVLTVTVEP